MRQRLSVVNLAVTDIARTRQFYEQGMKLPVRPESSERVFWIEMNKVWLGFFPRERLAELAGMDAHGEGFGGLVLSHNVSSPEEVDQVIEEAVAAGGTLVHAPKDTASGEARIGYFADPDGYRWEVAFTPRWKELTWPDGPEGD